MSQWLLIINQRETADLLDRSSFILKDLAAPVWHVGRQAPCNGRRRGAKPPPTMNTL